MSIPRLLCIPLLMLSSTLALPAQENSVGEFEESPLPRLSPGSEHKPVATTRTVTADPQAIPLTVPKKTSLQVALEKEVRVRKVGQAISACLVDPVYAFDRLVVPPGSEIRGKVTKIEPVSSGRRTLAGLDADFTPAHKVEVTFTDLVLPDGKHLSLHTSVTPGSGQVMQFVTAPEKESGKTVKDLASEKTNAAKQQARDEWNNAMKQLKTAGRMHGSSATRKRNYQYTRSIFRQARCTLRN